MYKLTSYGKSHLYPVTIKSATKKRVDCAIKAARKRWPGGRLYLRADGVTRYMSRHGVKTSTGLMCHILIERV